MNLNPRVVLQGMIGASTAIGASVISSLAQVETTLRVLSLLIGILVGLATLARVVLSLWRAVRRKK